MKELIRRVLREHTREMGEGEKWTQGENLTPEEIKKEALKYNTVGDFVKNSNRAYQKARNLGIYNDVTSHMEKIYRKPINWTPEEIKKEALKYNKLSDFIKNASGVVIKALKLGIYDDVTSRMEKK